MTEKGRIGPDAESRHGDGRQGEGGGAAERAGRVPQVLAENVQVRRPGVAEHVEDALQEERETGQRAGNVAPARGVGAAQLGAVLGAERGRIEVEEQPVEAHQILRGASPLARARVIRPASRRDSARATAMPYGRIL